MSEFGQRIYLSGIGTDVTESDLRELFQKYTEKTPDIVERVDINTARPAYIISFVGLVDGELQKFSDRINGMYWHGHTVVAHVM